MRNWDSGKHPHSGFPNLLEVLRIARNSHDQRNYKRGRIPTQSRLDDIVRNREKYVHARFQVEHCYSLSC